MIENDHNKFSKIKRKKNKNIFYNIIYIRYINIIFNIKNKKKLNNKYINLYLIQIIFSICCTNPIISLIILLGSKIF